MHEREAKDNQGRRRVRELNKQAESATTVRRVPAQHVAPRKAPPNTAVACIAATLARDPELDLGVQGSGIAR